MSFASFCTAFKGVLVSLLPQAPTCGNEPKTSKARRIWCPEPDLNRHDLSIEGF